MTSPSADAGRQLAAARVSTCSCSTAARCKVHAYLSPTFNFTGSTAGLRYAISFDDEPPQIVNAQADTTRGRGRSAVADNIHRAGVVAHARAAGRARAEVLDGRPGRRAAEDSSSRRATIAPSYLGPPESFYRWTPTKPSTVRWCAEAGLVAAKRGRVTSRRPTLDAAPPLDAASTGSTYEGNDSRLQALDVGARISYINPILAGFYPDPSITRVGRRLLPRHVELRVLPRAFRSSSSKDLVHWTQIGHVLDRPSQLKLDSAGISRGIFAPVDPLSRRHVLHDHHARRSRRQLHRDGEESGRPVVRSDLAARGFDGIDPSLFFDDDGRAYIVNNGPPVGDAAVRRTPRDLDAGVRRRQRRSSSGRASVIVNGGVDLSKKPIWIEAPHIFKVKGAVLSDLRRRRHGG